MDRIEYTYGAYILDLERASRYLSSLNKWENVYGVPRGGTIFAMDLARKLNLPLSTSVTSTDTLIVDDIADSGATRMMFPKNDFVCLHTRNHCDPNKWPTYSVNRDVKAWVVYWWEGTAEDSIKNTIIRQLQYIGEDPDREGLKDTPGRVVRSWDTLFGGYTEKPSDQLTVFTDDTSDQMVLLKDIEFYSTCEHHLLPFFGKCHIAYLPKGKIVGISKLARLMEIYARRLQIQERLGKQITDALDKYLKPAGSACVLQAQHFCMTSRGVQKQHSVMVTSSLTGVFLHDATARAEFLSLAGVTR